jgi:GNAT superfamily N-acetyltransferase
MEIQAQRADYPDVQAMRELFRQEANCQIIHDSFFSRGLADPYVILLNGRLAGYAGIGNKYPKGRLIEFYTFPEMHRFALPMFREVLVVSGATEIEAQSNIPRMLLLLYDCAKNITTSAILFEDSFTTDLLSPDVVFRQATPEDATSIFPHAVEPAGDWVLVANGSITATGGFLSHYNPPYGDIYMEVAEPARQQGFGSFLVQELKRVCYEAGKKPAARCDPANLASRRTLQKAGLLPCGRLLAGEVDTDLFK